MKSFGYSAVVFGVTLMGFVACTTVVVNPPPGSTVTSVGSSGVGGSGKGGGTASGKGGGTASGKGGGPASGTGGGTAGAGGDCACGCTSDNDCLAGLTCDTSTGVCMGTPINVTCHQCACVDVLSTGGCGDVCSMALNGTKTPNFCDGVPALHKCAQCLMDRCGNLGAENPPNPTDPSACN
jgi:hypothetical protein